MSANLPLISDMLWLPLLAPLSLALTASPRAGVAARFSTPQMAASWGALSAASSRDDSIAALNALKDEDQAPLWNSFKLAPRAVTLREVCQVRTRRPSHGPCQVSYAHAESYEPPVPLRQTTKLDETVLDPTATEFSLEDIQNTFIKVIIGCTVGATAWAVGSDALGLDAGLRFTGTYLFAGIPIGVLAIGSTAPGILFLPIEAFRAATANEEQRRARGERVCKHEASHLLCAHVLGLPVQEVLADVGKGPRVVVYDEEAATQPGVLVSEKQIAALAVVAMSGLMAEADAYGKALGAQEDLKLLNNILVRCQPPIPAQKQQDTTRYAALTAWTIIKKHRCAYDAITAALQNGEGVAACLRAAEEAEAAQSVDEKAAAAARAEAIAKETPQERAAREREEMAARGRF